MCCARWGETYLLINYKTKEEKAYSLFPSAAFISSGYRLTADGNAATAQPNNKTELAFGKKFYIGFHNTQEKAYLATVSNAEYGINKAGNSPALIFDYPRPTSYPALPISNK